MAQTTAALRKTVKFPGAGASLEEKCTKCGDTFGNHDGQRCPAKSKQVFVDGVCNLCGHDFDDHPGEGNDATCPPLPPAKSKQVSVDEAVVAKGGKPGFMKQLEDATGETDTRAKLKLAEEHFERRPGEPARESIAIEHLVPMAHNPRGELGDVSSLVKSIETNGFIGALSVRQDEPGRKFEVWAGNRRLKAAKLAGLTEVPCDVYEISALQALELNLTEQINRSDLTPLEEGEACRSLIELSGYDTKQVATKLGQSPSWVTKRLSLCGLAAEVKKSLTKGEITVTLAQALAALPTQKMQIDAVQALEDAAEDNYGEAITTEDQLATLREEFCRPLKGVSWKLVDADLLPLAGPCSTCPKNSANNQAPGLFDNVKAPPTCSSLPCFEQKMAAAWERATAKYKADGAKVLPLGESTTKLFNAYNSDVSLNYGSRYVAAKAVVQEDGGKRSWAQIIEKMKPEERPQLHVAQDPKGGIWELYVADKATAAIAEHLELKWARKAIDRQEAVASAPVERKEEQQARAIRLKVINDVKGAVTKAIAKTGVTLPIARSIAGDPWEIRDYLMAIGVEAKSKDAWLKGASINDLLAYAFFTTTNFDSYSDKFEASFLELAKAYGLDPKAMAKAYVDGAKSEAAIDAKKKAKK